MRPRCPVCAARVRSFMYYALHRVRHVLRGEVRKQDNRSEQGI